MKGNLNQREPLFIEFWKKNNIYEKINEQAKNQPLMVFIDGPPYANGRIHLGTALNKILKDILVKQAVMAGKSCPFTPIWDCHGLPIELRALKKTKSRLPKDIRSACREEALHWINIQKNQFERIGVLADWKNKILTMDPSYEAQEVQLFARLVEQNLIYKGKRPIHWCMKLQTATAVSEVEYKNHKSPSIDIQFEIKNTPLFKNKDKTFLAVWTTTPWTLPANQAVSVHPDFEYGLYESSKGRLIVCQDLKEPFQKRTGLELKLKQTFKGRDLENTSYKHPLMDRQCPVILSAHVTLDAGTGLVHTAPAHGADDFTAGKKYSLPITCPVNEAGCFTSEVKDYEGENVFKANPKIIERLKSLNLLIHHEEIEHSYPYHPRSKSPLIFRTTDQWFLNFENSKNPIRKTALDKIEKEIRFTPSWNRQRLAGMIQESPDWCLSRQRVWGVPIIVFYCQNCSHPLLEPQLIRSIADQMEKTKQGIEYFYEKTAKELIGGSLNVCEKCSSREFKKGSDILDVWFDSGVCHFVFTKIKGESFFPADIYLEGSDQHRGWFQTSLNSSIAYNKKSPFKTLITHGFVYDIEKRKMSKSLGNIINPEDIIKQHGAEILRMWAASSDYARDISSGEEVLRRVRETYRRWRNTVRFLLGNIYDLHSEKDLIPISETHELDQWILSLLSKVHTEALGFYKNFEFHKVYQTLNRFFTVELSSIYFDIIKDRLYTFKAGGKDRRSAQSALYYLLDHLLPLMAPITSFLSEEAYQQLPDFAPKKESVFLKKFKTPPWRDEELEQKFNTLLNIRAAVNKKIEALRDDKALGSSLSAHLELTLPPSDYKLLKSYARLRELFIVSCVDIAEGEALKIKIKKAGGRKCIRCWHYDTNLTPEEICPKCVQNLK